MATPISISIIVFISTTFINSAQSQLVALRHPESDHHMPPRRQPTSIQIDNNIRPPLQQQQQLPPRTKPGFTAKPGNVIVHFDRSHEIQLLQYVLQDGRLATLYQRHPQHPQNSRLPMEIPSGREPLHVHRRDEQGLTTPTLQSSSLGESVPATTPSMIASSSPEPNPSTVASTKGNPVRIDHNSTIEVLDSKMQSVSKLIGDHLTVALQDHNLGGATNTKADNTNDEQNRDSAADERLDIIATVAVDAIAAGAQVGEAKLKKAGVFLDKLKNKVAAKLHDLPSIIGAKLRAKSSTGQVFLDQYGNKIQLIDELASTISSHDSTNEQPNVSNAKVQTPPSNIDNRRVVPVPPNFMLDQQQAQPKTVVVRYNQQLSPQHLYPAD